MKLKVRQQLHRNQKGVARKVIKAQKLWYAIIESQIETGTPYMLYKDACNAKSNQQNLGTIKCSNLCTEIVEYTAPGEVAVCNLASIALPSFVVNKVYTTMKVITLDYLRLGKVKASHQSRNEKLEQNYRS